MAAARFGYGGNVPEPTDDSARDLARDLARDSAVDLDVAVDTVVLDVDGTLLDSVYQHVRAWDEAFRRVGVEIPSWRLHRAIGMGGDRIVTAVAGQAVEDACGDAVRGHHDERFSALLRDIRPLPGAAELLSALRSRGHKVVLASSGSPEHTSEAVERIGAEGHIHDWISGKGMAHTKPAPDSLAVAVERVGGQGAAVIGDSVWDMRAATAGSYFAVGLLSGGFGAGELREAGASLVFDDPADLADHLDETPLVRASAATD